MSPRISFSKEQLAGPPPLDPGLYEVRLEGFEPEASKKGSSTNLNPILKVINHPTHTGKRIFDNLNTGAYWIIPAFVHAFGFKLEDDGQGGFAIPGEFNGDNYVGPLTGSVGKLIVKQTEYNGRSQFKVDQWLCQVPGCTEKHPNNLAK
jgi:hypothetical protein